MNIAKDIKPITFLKNHAAELVEDVATNHKTMIITQHGEPKVVVMDVASYDRLQESLAMLMLVAQGQADIRAGRVVPQEQVFANLRTRLKSRLVAARKRDG